MTDDATIKILRQQLDDAWDEIDRLRDRLAAYERDLFDKDIGNHRSQDTDWLRAGFLQRGAEIERLEAERDDHEQARAALEEALAQTAAELREYRRATIQRDESVPGWAFAWRKDSRVARWIGEARSLGVTRIANPDPLAPAYATAPDLRPDEPGPITLPIVDVE